MAVIVRKVGKDEYEELEFMPEEVPPFARNELHKGFIMHRNTSYTFGHMQVSGVTSIVEVWEESNEGETLLAIIWNPSAVGLTTEEIKDLLVKYSLVSGIESIWE